MEMTLAFQQSNQILAMYNMCNQDSNIVQGLTSF
jgi:hypothetical protein